MFKIYEFISPKVLYKCPLCGKYYKTYDDAKNCIEKHSIPDSIISYDAMSEISNCPSIIYVKLNDGREIKYVFDEIIKEKGGESDDIA